MGGIDDATIPPIANDKDAMDGAPGICRGLLEADGTSDEENDRGGADLGGGER
jgi:hypothetical protein